MPGAFALPSWAEKRYRVLNASSPLASPSGKQACRPRDSKSGMQVMMPLFRRSTPDTVSPWGEPELLASVTRRIRAQRTFTRGYSKLYSSLLDCALEWLSATEASVERLGEKRREEILKVGEASINYVQSSRRSALEDSLGFAAALHSFVLDEDPRCKELRPYYASVGGTKDSSEDGFESALLQSMFGLGPDLFERAKLWRVQTNETSRGVTWLLPASLLGVESAHLVELGASAGLNLYAEQRRYALKLSQEQGALELGAPGPVEFEIPTELAADLAWPSALEAPCPQVSSRQGADFSPLDLKEAQAQLHLKACVWPDQPARLARLQRGIDLHQQAQEGGFGPVARLHPAKLPEDLESFLRKAIPAQPRGPVIVYNTYVTEYFNDVDERGMTRRMRDFARRWSIQHKLPMMWVRFEPPRKGEAPAPRRGWCRWDLELFTGAGHQEMCLGWAHPHFQGLILGPGFHELIAAGA